MGHGDEAEAPMVCFSCGVFLGTHRAGFALGKVGVVNDIDLATGEVLMKTRNVLV